MCHLDSSSQALKRRPEVDERAWKTSSGIACCTNDRVRAMLEILVVAHYCGGSASGVFGQAQGGGIVAAADRSGFIMIFPQTTNAATSAKCWDVGSRPGAGP